MNVDTENQETATNDAPEAQATDQAEAATDEAAEQASQDKDSSCCGCCS